MPRDLGLSHRFSSPFDASGADAVSHPRIDKNLVVFVELPIELFAHAINSSSDLVAGR
jgi:hypothetical protein